MDTDLKELLDTIAKVKTADESTLKIKWGVLIGILVVVCGSLFTGFITNNVRITRLEDQIKHFTEKNVEFAKCQTEFQEALNVLKEDYIRRQAKEGK